MRRIAAMVLVMALGASSVAQAADLGLSPGRPAGVQQANIAGLGVPTLVFGGIMAGIAIAIAVASSNENTPALASGSVTPSTSTTTTTTTTTRPTTTTSTTRTTSSTATTA